MLDKLTYEQLENLIRQVDSEFKPYFKSKDAELDSFGWCFGSIGGISRFSDADFNNLPREIRFRARRILQDLTN